MNQQPSQKNSLDHPQESKHPPHSTSQELCEGKDYQIYAVGGAIRDAYLENYFFPRTPQNLEEFSSQTKFNLTQFFPAIQDLDLDFVVVGLDRDKLLQVFPQAQEVARGIPVFKLPVTLRSEKSFKTSAQLNNSPDLQDSVTSSSTSQTAHNLEDDEQQVYFDLNLARIDKKYQPGIYGFKFHTEQVTLEQEWQRRDLTINCLYYPVSKQQLLSGQFNPYLELADPTNRAKILDPSQRGLQDLEQLVIAPCSEQFFLDPSRPSRAAYYFAKLNAYLEQALHKYLAQGFCFPANHPWQNLFKNLETNSPLKVFPQQLPCLPKFTISSRFQELKLNQLDLEDLKTIYFKGNKLLTKHLQGVAKLNKLLDYVEVLEQFKVIAPLPNSLKLCFLRKLQDYLNLHQEASNPNLAVSEIEILVKCLISNSAQGFTFWEIEDQEHLTQFRKTLKNTQEFDQEVFNLLNYLYFKLDEPVRQIIIHEDVD